jgi:entericidin A
LAGHFFVQQAVWPSLSPVDDRRPLGQSIPDVVPNTIMGIGNLNSTEASMSKLVATLVLMASLFAVSACNTIHGVGEDVESVGDTIADEAKD